jgi:hypothetical protein
VPPPKLGVLRRRPLLGVSADSTRGALNQRLCRNQRVFPAQVSHAGALSFTSTQGCAITYVTALYAGVDGLAPGEEVQGGLALFAERVGGGVLHATERHVQVEPRRRTVDLDDAGLRTGGELGGAGQ